MKLVGHTKSVIKVFFHYVMVFVIILFWIFTGQPNFVGKVSFPPGVQVAHATTDTYVSSGTWQAPTGVTSVTVECWGGGGGGGGNATLNDGAGGGGGGAYSKKNSFAVTPGNNYTVTVGSGGVGVTGSNGTAGGDSWFNSSGTVLSKGGGYGAAPVGGAGGVGGTAGQASAGIGDIKYSGGNGGTGRDNKSGTGGGGGGGAGDAADGGTGGNGGPTSGGAGGTGGTSGGGAGGSGGGVGVNGNPGSVYGGGGSGSGDDADGANPRTGGAGAGGRCLITYTANVAPAAPSQDSPTNSATGVSITPTFTMTTTDPDSDNISYKVTIYSNSGCTTVVQTNDQAVSSTGWSGTDASCTASPTSCYASGTQGSFLTQTSLSNSTQYWWKASAKDPDGYGSFTDSATCNNFTTQSANAAPTLTVSQPDGTGDTVVQGASYNITYDLADTDDTVTVAFYYDTNSSGLDGTAIAAPCAAAPEGTGATCAWNTAGVAAGSYYVYGITDDGTNPAVNDYSSGTITINAPSLTFSISDNDIFFGDLSPSATKWADNTADGSATASVAHTITASTNATNGYTITVQGATLTSTSAPSDNITAMGTEATLTTGQEEFGLRITASGGNGAVDANYDNTPADSYFYGANATTTDVIASDPDGDDVTTTYSLYYASNITTTTEAHTDYTANLTFVATGNF